MRRPKALQSPAKHDASRAFLSLVSHLHSLHPQKTDAALDHQGRELLQFPLWPLFLGGGFNGFNNFNGGGGAAASSAASPGSVTSSVAAGRRLQQFGNLWPLLFLNGGFNNGFNNGGGAAASSAASPGGVSSSVAVPGAAAGSAAGGGSSSSNVAVGRKMLSVVA